MSQSPTPRVPYLTSAELPAVGAYTSTAAIGVASRQAGVTAWITYTRGGASGYPVFRILWGNATDEDFRRAVLDSALTAVAPEAQQSLHLNIFKGPVPADGTAIKYITSFDVPPGATTFRLLAAEEGNTGAPGTCAISLTGVLDQ